MLVESLIKNFQAICIFDKKQSQLETKMRLKVARCSEASIDSLDLIDWQGALSLVEPKTTYDWPGPRGRGENRGGRGRSKKGGTDAKNW